MPIATKNYGLIAFTGNDAYLSSSDKKRLTIIDNQFDFLSGIVGDGVITGWDLTDVSQSNIFIISVAPGMGVIDRVVTRTFGDLQYTIEDNQTLYLFVQKKLDYLGGFSGFSDIVTVTFSDTFAPPAPSYLTATGWDFDFISIDWDSDPLTEPDFDHFVVHRSTDGFITETSVTTTSPNYTDTDVTEETAYSYRITSVDETGNESGVSPVVNITTLIDSTPPIVPSYLLVFPGDEYLDVMWKRSESGSIDRYEIWIQALDEEYNTTGLIYKYSVGSSAREYKIEGLSNGTFYNVAIYAVSENGVFSQEVMVRDAPVFNLGPISVLDIDVSDQKSVKNQYGISLNIGWTPGSDPYQLKFPVYRYIITIIENGLTVATPIYVYDEVSIVLDLFFVDGIYKPILPRTDYIVKIETEDVDGNLSRIVVARYETQNYLNPLSPVFGNSIYEDADGNLIFEWSNSTDEIENNIITLTRKDLSTSVDTIIENATEYGDRTIYIIEQDDLVLNSTYTMSVYAVDEFGLSSEPTQSSYDLPVVTGNIEAPRNIGAYKGDRSVLLTWSHVTDSFPQYYKVWRANYKNFGIRSSDFSLIDTIPAENNHYYDYSVSNGGRYLYFITTVDIYGRESLTPTNDGFFSYARAFSYAQEDVTFSIVEDLMVTIDGFDAIVSWLESVDEFDGYEIFRSDADKVSWEKIGSVSKEFNVFIDEGALTKGGTEYHYMVRKFRNEGLLISSTSLDNTPIRSTLLARISVFDGNLSIDTSVSDQLGDLVKVASEFLEEKLPEHVHDLTSEADRRVDLSKNIIVTDWTTSDNQTFITTQNIAGATSYVALIDDTTIAYEVIVAEGKVVFAKDIGTDSLSLQCVGLTEVKGTIVGDKIGSLSATQVYSGKIPDLQLSDISHGGRLKEELIPLQLPMTTDDGYEFKIQQNELGQSENIGTSITFYDVVRLSDGSMSAATSSGMMSNNSGSWKVMTETDSAPHKMYYASSIEQYFVLTGTSVYISVDAVTWVKCSGFDDVHIVRDIISDVDGYVFVSTDKGVYRFYIDGELGQYLRWEQTPSMDVETSNCYGLWDDDGRLVVDVESRLYYSIDKGQTWSPTDDIEEGDIVRVFYESGNYIYALTDTSLWRKTGSGEFEKISYFDADVARKIVVFDDTLLISSDSGLLVSSTDSNIYEDAGITFYVGYKRINFTNKIVPVTCLSVSSDLIHIGTDARLFSGSSMNGIDLAYDGTSTIVPSVYVNSVLQQIGFTYYTVDNTVRFDDFVEYDNIVSVANQYRLFVVPGEGWIGQRYSADVEVYNKGVSIATMSGENVFILTPFEEVEFEDFTEFDSHSEGANSYVSSYESELQDLRDAYNAGSTNIQPYVTTLVNTYNKVYSQVLGDIRYATTITIGDDSFVVSGSDIVPFDLYTQIFSDYEIVSNIPSLIISDSSAIVSANVSDGVFEFTSSYDKYDYLVADIRNITLKNEIEFLHKEIDDNIEEINSGLPHSFSEAQQTNIIKSSIFFERTWPGEQVEYDQCNLETLSPYHMYYYIPTSSDWYDTLNSTVDYQTEIEYSNTGVSVDYCTSVLYTDATNIVLVGHTTGVLSVSTVDLELSVLNFNGGREEFVRDIQMFDGIVYILTDDNLYKSSDDGVTWAREVEMAGLAGTFYSISKINDFLIVSTEQGIFYKDVISGFWVQSIVADGITLLNYSDYLVAIKDGNNVYYSRNGLSWQHGGEIDLARINSVTNYNSILLLSTDKGLRFDNSTFYTVDPATALIDIENNKVLSETIVFNDAAVHATRDEYVGGATNGNYYRWDGSSYTEFTTDLETIHKVVIVGDDYWLFGYGSLKVSSLDYVIRLSTGVPF